MNVLLVSKLAGCIYMSLRANDLTENLTGSPQVMFHYSKLLINTKLVLSVCEREIPIFPLGRSDNTLM